MSDLSSSVSSGSRPDALKAIRDRLACELDTAEGTEVAALSRELRAVLLELERLGVRAEVSPLDHLAASVVRNIDDARSRRQPNAASS